MDVCRGKTDVRWVGFHPPHVLTFYNKMFFLGLSGFWTKAQNEENKNLLYSVR
jgi:hypothetical protein